MVVRTLCEIQKIKDLQKVGVDVMAFEYTTKFEIAIEKNGDHKTGRALFYAIATAIVIVIAQTTESRILILLALASYLATVLFTKDGAIFPLFLFFLPWSTILKLSPGSISFASIATILVFLKYCVKEYFNNGRIEIERNLIISVFAMAVITILAKIFHMYDFSANYIMFFFMLVAFPFLYYKVGNKTDFVDCIRFYSIGIILASISSLLFGDSPGISRYVNVYSDGYLFVGVRRLCGFYADPNFYSAQIVTAFGGLLLVMTETYKKSKINLVLCITILVCGLVSVSKAFLLCVVLVAIAWLFSVLFSHPTKLFSILLALITIAGIALASGALDSIIEQYTIRFNLSTNSASLTTGRTELWTEYMIFLMNSLPNFLLGQGYTSVFNSVSMGSHNTVIQCVYQLGVLGFIVLVIWFFLFDKRSTKRKFELWPCICWLIACFSMWTGLDILFFDDFFLNVVLFWIGIGYLRSTSKRALEK